jgi:hypothetical protein
MKKAMNNLPAGPESSEMLPEYDLTGKRGVRGKYYQAYRQGHTVRICKEDGTVSIQHFTLEEGAVMLEPDVREYFPTSESVNQALRSVIMLIPKTRRKRQSRAKRRGLSPSCQMDRRRPGRADMTRVVRET